MEGGRKNHWPQEENCQKVGHSSFEVESTQDCPYLYIWQEILRDRMIPNLVRTHSPQLQSYSVITWYLWGDWLQSYLGYQNLWMPKLLRAMVSIHITCTHHLYDHEKSLGLPVASQRFVMRTEVYRDHVIDLMQRCLVGTEVYRDHVTELMQRCLVGTGVQRSCDRSHAKR